MKKILWLLMISFFAIEASHGQRPASDTIMVQAFTFGNSRDSVILFPSDTNRYEKILMYYTLKCDPRQNPACGEWDYLTYTNLYYPTGTMDSTQLSHPSFILDGETPDTAFYGQSEVYSQIVNTINYRHRSQLSTSDTTTMGAGAIMVQNPLASVSGSQRSTYLFRASELLGSGLKAGPISDLAVHVNSSSTYARAVTVRLSHTADSIISLNPNATAWSSRYDQSLAANGSGPVYIPLNLDFIWDGASNLLLEISYHNYHKDGLPATPTRDADGDSTSYASSLSITEPSRPFLFDGSNDYVNAGEHAWLKGASAFTIEGWIKVNQWKNWSKPIGKGSAVGFELGSNTGSLYAMVRTNGNTYGNTGNVLTVGDWHHIAMVYDGIQSGNANRLKIYVDGVSQSLSFGGTIPATAPTNDDPFTFGGRSAGQFFPGAADNVRIWSKALSASEIADHMSSSSLLAHPAFSDLQGQYLGAQRKVFNVPNTALSSDSAVAMNGVQAEFTSPAQFSAEILSTRPKVEFIQSVYSFWRPDSDWRIDSMAHFPSMLLQFNDPLDPSLASDTLPVLKRSVQYSRWTLGSPSDSVIINTSTSLKLDTNYYYSDPFEVIRRYEIGRFITPYGIGLDLGPGFTWVSDITDYAPILHDSLRLTAGNWQELLDLKFAFVKGIPPRDALRIDQPWGTRRSYRYDQLDADVVMKEADIELNPNASSYKLKSRITGHGHNGLSGRPHCCEWSDKGHYLELDGQLEFSWSIWQTTECGTNPVYPQGGTWPHARAGWCPGAPVPDYDHELTPLVTPGSRLKIDYSIDPVPSNNLAQGGGNYHMAWHLISYGDANHDDDVSVEDIISPSTRDEYNRINPICGSPIIEIRNSGKNILTSARITYGPVGGNKKVMNWRGGLEFMEEQQVMLEPIDWSSWAGTNEFEVTIDQPSGKTDEYSPNNTMRVPFERVQEFPDRMIIWLTTNNAPQETSYTIYDVYGNVVHRLSNLAPGRAYRDTIQLNAGCYKFRVDDTDGDGISYWANNDGNGSLRLWNLNTGGFVKVFEPDFGSFNEVNFTVGYALGNDIQMMEAFADIYPNPSNGSFNLDYQLDEFGDLDVLVTDLHGKMVYKKLIRSTLAGVELIDLNHLEDGIYLVQLKSSKSSFSKKIVLLRD